MRLLFLGDIVGNSGRQMVRDHLPRLRRELALDAVLAKLVGPVFDKIAASMVDAFVQRAEQVHGGPAAA